MEEYKSLISKAKNLRKEKLLKEALKAVCEAIEFEKDNYEGYLLKGWINFDSDKFDEALIDFNKVIELDPKCSRAFFGKGCIHSELKEYEEALRYLNLAVKYEPECYFYYSKRAFVNLQLKNYKQAIEDSKTTILKDDKDADAYIVKGLSEYYLKKYDYAILDLSKAGNIRQNDSYCYYCKAAVYSKLNQTNAAIENYKKAIEYNPIYDEAYYELSLIKFETGDLEGAISDIKRAISMKPDNTTYKECLEKYEKKSAINKNDESNFVENCTEITIDLLSNGKFESAKNAIDKILSFNKGLSEASEYYDKGKKLYEEEKYEEAAESFSKAIEAKPESAALYLNRGLAYDWAGDMNKALIDYRKFAELNPDDRDAYYYEGNVLYRLERYRESNTVLSKGIRKFPDDKYLYNERGRVKIVLEDYYEAIENFDRAIELDEDKRFDYAYFNRGRAKYWLKEYEDAIKDFLISAELSTKKQYDYYWAGNCYLEMDKYTDAINMYDEAIKADGDYPMIYCKKSIALVGLKRDDEALECLNIAIQEGEDEYEKYVSIRGDYYREKEEYEKAIEDYTAAIETKCATLGTYLNRAYCEIKTGKYQEAIKDADDVIEDTEEIADAFYYRGLAKSELEDFKGAVEDFEKGLEIEPDNEEIIRSLEYARNSLKCLQNDDPVAFNIRGIEKYNSKDYKGAIDDFNKAIELKQKITKELMTNTQEKDPENMSAFIENCKKVAELDENYSELLQNSIKAKESIGDYESTIKDYKELIINAPCAENYKKYGFALYNTRKYEEASEYLTKAIEEGAECDFELYHTLAQAEYYISNYASAIEYYHLTLEIKEEAYVYYNMGLAYEYDGNIEEAFKNYIKSFEMYPEECDYHGRAEDTYSKINKKKNLIHYYSNIIKNDSNNKEAYYFRGYLYYSTDSDREYPKAIKDFKKAIELGYSESNVYKYMGLTMNISEKYPPQEVIGTLKKALENKDDTDTKDIYFFLSQNYIYLSNEYYKEKYDKRNDKEVISHCMKIIEALDKAKEYANLNDEKADMTLTDYHISEIYYLKGVANHNLCNMEQAEKDFQNAIEIIKEEKKKINFEGDLYYYYGMSLLALGQNNKAYMMFEKAHKINPKDTESKKYMKIAKNGF